MLSRTENVFVRILRDAVIFTASIALLITVGALIYAGYAYFSPEPEANLRGRINDFRHATDPLRLIYDVIPKDSSVAKDAAATPDQISYESADAPDQTLFGQMNKFISVAFGATFQSESKFADWLHGSGDSRIPFTWSKAIDDENAENEDHVEYLFRSLLLDYAKRLSVYGNILAKARKQNLYGPSFDQFTAPTGSAEAPYFLAWFFNQLQSQLQIVDAQLKQDQAQRDVLRLTAIPAMIVAGGAFGYFVAIVFCFLFISIEASLRKIAETQQLTRLERSSAESPLVGPSPPVM